jgi:hypothetical protein
MPLLPTDAAERKKIPLWSGLMQYFPLTLIEVAKLSYIVNEQHNKGEKLHWAREKSTDQEDTLLRHLMEKGTIDSDGIRHVVKCVWRCMAMSELELEAARKEQQTSQISPTADKVTFRPRTSEDIFGRPLPAAPRPYCTCSNPNDIPNCLIHGE